MKTTKRKYLVLLCVLALAALLLAGCAQENALLEYIGEESAGSLALEAAGLTAGQVEYASARLYTKNGVDYYAVELTVDGVTYEFDVDALTGVIIDGEPPASDGQAAQETAEAAAASGEVSGSGEASAAGTAITGEEAKAAALAHAGLTEAEVTFTKTKLDTEDGRQVYDVEFYTDSAKYDYEIDAATGDVLKSEYDLKSAAAVTGTAITQAEAKAIALAQVPGASASDIREFETDYDDGRLQYEGKIIYDGMEYEFEIDGYSGAIRSWETERLG